MTMWPQALIAELASRRCLVFLGAGASAGCSSAVAGHRPLTWGDFLTKLKALMHSEADKVIVDEFIQKEKFLDAAEIMFDSISPADFSRFVRQEFVNPRFKPSNIHKAVLEIDPKIVITTNYDDIYDNYCRQGEAQDGYNICRYYESHLVSDLRSPVRQIIKAHGCVSDPSQIVLTRSQYFKEKQKHSNFYKVLDSLFLTNTLFFVGYSLSDPDIQLVLENVNISAESSHPHYALIPNDLHDSIKRSASKAFNIEFIEYEAGNYEQVDNMLGELSEMVSQFRERNPI